MKEQKSPSKSKQDSKSGSVDKPKRPASPKLLLDHFPGLGLGSFKKPAANQVRLANKNQENDDAYSDRFVRNLVLKTANESTEPAAAAEQPLVHKRRWKRHRPKFKIKLSDPVQQEAVRQDEKLNKLIIKTDQNDGLAVTVKKKDKE